MASRQEKTVPCNKSESRCLACCDTALGHNVAAEFIILYSLYTCNLSVYIVEKCDFLFAMLFFSIQYVTDDKMMKGKISVNPESKCKNTSQRFFGSKNNVQYLAAAKLHGLLTGSSSFIIAVIP